MKLNLAPSGSALRWFKLAAQLFWQAPFAFMLLLLLESLVIDVISIASTQLAWPWPNFGRMLRQPLALFFVPTLQLAFMAMAHAIYSKQPDKWHQVGRALRKHAQALAGMGMLYAGLFMLPVLLSYALDGGVFLRLYLFQTLPEAQVLENLGFVLAFALTAFVQLLLYTLLVYVPVLLHWFGLSMPRSVFYSGVATYKNARAWLGLYGWWSLVALAAVLVLTLLAQTLYLPPMVGLVVLLISSAWFLAGLYFPCLEAFAAPDAVQNTELPKN